MKERFAYSSKALYVSVSDLNIQTVTVGNASIYYPADSHVPTLTYKVHTVSYCGSCSYEFNAGEEDLFNLDDELSAQERLLPLVVADYEKYCIFLKDKKDKIERIKKRIADLRDEAKRKQYKGKCNE